MKYKLSEHEWDTMVEFMMEAHKKSFDFEINMADKEPDKNRASFLVAEFNRNMAVRYLATAIHQLSNKKNNRTKYIEEIVNSAINLNEEFESSQHKLNS
jgi:hypothetical protein